MAYSGMQINGSMEVSQEKGFAATVFTGTHLTVIDNWHAWSIGVQGMQGFLNSFAPPGYSYSLQLAVLGTANPSPAAGDSVWLHQYIEGYRTSRLAWGTPSAQPLTIAFWINITRAGTYSVAARNGAGNRTYIATFTVTAANAWEYKTVTIPGDTTGTWLKDNGIGVGLFFTFMAGSAATQAPNVWSANGNVSPAGITNLVAATTDYVLLTGVVVLPGIEAPSAARSPLIMRPYDQELVTCQRYYYKRSYLGSQWFATLQAYATNLASGPIFDFPVSMRASPTVAYSGDGILSNASGTGFSLNAGTYSATTEALMISAASAASITFRAGDAVMFGASTGVVFSLSARL